MRSFNSLILLLVSLTIPFGSFAASHAQTGNPIVLRPESPWQVNYADDSCRLARSFTDGKSRHVWSVDQFEPSNEITLFFAGPSFSGDPRRRARIAFGPGGAAREFKDWLLLTLKDVGPAIRQTGFGLLEDYSRDVGRPSNPEPLPAKYLAPASTREAAISWMDFSYENRSPVRFELGPMDKPIQALRKCTEELLALWGLDAAAHRTLTRHVVPHGNPGRWITNADYPDGLVWRGVQGLIQFCLMIEDTGAVSDCVIQQSTRPAEFDKLVCNLLRKRARFAPALDAAGKPIKSYWRSSLTFMILS